MGYLVTGFAQLDFVLVLWLFLCAFVLHEFEEWNITECERRNFVDFSSTVTARNARMWIGFICVVGFVWCAAATLSGDPLTAAYVFLPAVALALGNSLQHVFWTFYFRQYAPGFVTAVLLLIPLGGYAIFRAVQQAYVPLWYAAALTVLMAVPVAQAVRAGNRMTSPVQAVYNLGGWLAKKMG